MLARKPRERGHDGAGERSWFGGLPRLGGAAWPAGPDGVPLPFAAQIDLAELAAACPESPLPHAGWLAFFLNAGAVVFVDPGDPAPTPAPPGLPPAFDEGGPPLPQRPTRVSRALFPFWPVQAIGLPLPEALRDTRREQDHEAIWAAQHALLAERVPGGRGAFSAGSARRDGVAGTERLWWHGALHVLQRLHDSRDSVEWAVDLRRQWIAQARGLQARLAAAGEPPQAPAIVRSRESEARHAAQIPDIRRQGEALGDFIAAFEDFTAGHASWDPMDPGDIDALAQRLRQARAHFPDLCAARVPQRLDELRELCVRRMVTEGGPALAALPDELLARVNACHRLADGPHQVFGLASVRQQHLYDHLGDLLLLQIGHDPMNEWGFGDMGLWQFWIHPADAAAGRWHRAQLTFECS